jgi:hypothetical protein
VLLARFVQNRRRFVHDNGEYDPPVRAALLPHRSNP